MKETEIKTLDTLISELEEISKVNHPYRVWDEEFRTHVKFAWIGKEKELEQRIVKLKKANETI